MAKRAASEPLSAKPCGKSKRRAVFDVRNSTPIDFHNAADRVPLNHDERLPVLVVLGFFVYDELRAASGRATLDHLTRPIARQLLTGKGSSGVRITKKTRG